MNWVIYEDFFCLELSAWSGLHAVGGITQLVWRIRLIFSGEEKIYCFTASMTVVVLDLLYTPHSPVYPPLLPLLSEFLQPGATQKQAVPGYSFFQPYTGSVSSQPAAF